ncbi:LysR family transcriptional regulator [Mangrovibrevibacter kandeliae]|uniref:LysR family transcriptional regulator n=1 Tax=Mangrovibrevibacter kandeliae TaxID=2968473 RepID=UPI002118EEAF|nr:MULTISPECIES: LysR family transcriptional regulator [unclassified Aurantimonas]MCQ8783597.1 LysR family transcriptional regulator [Aurantimonas sp. CSK15Z-1]MCW4116443.1 LysR family transcriptional regulator [Aurantimonas sp. MSK8Z-1]
MSGTHAAGRLDSDLLGTFLAVCESGSMTGAARRLGVSQGAISQRIGRLEKTLSLTLLQRTGREVSLTSAGRNLRFHAQKVVDELRECERAMRTFSNINYPEISVGILNTLGKNLMSTLVQTLEPVVEQIRIRAAVTYSHPEDLESGAIDLLITAYEFDDARYDIYPIVDEPLVILAPKGLIAKNTMVDLEALAGRLPMIRFANSRRPLRKLADAYLAQQGVTVTRSIETDQASSALASVGGGQGWAISTPFMVLDPFFDHREIDVIALPPPVLVRKINLVARPGEFADIPGNLAVNCRRHLQKEIETRLAPFLPASVHPRVQG